MNNNTPIGVLDSGVGGFIRFKMSAPNASP